MSYHLEDVEILSKLLGEEIEIPSLDSRADLRAGEIATLLFSDGDRVEPLRVQVVDDTPGRYLGMLIEEPLDIPVDPRRPIRFDEYQVAWIEAPNHAALSGSRLSGLFDWARPTGQKGSPPPPRQVPPGPPAAPEHGAAYPAYAPGTERIPMDAPARPPVFYLPGPVSQPLIPATAPKPSEGGLFSWAKPAAKKQAASDVSVYKPGPQPRGGEQEELFSMWSPEVLKAERERNRGRDLSDVIVPEEAQGSIYRQEAPAARQEVVPREESREPSSRASAPKSAPWLPPSVAWMKAKLAEIFDLKDLWKIVREDRESEYFQEALVNGGEFGDGARAELQTVSYSEEGNWVVQIFDFFGVDYEPVRERVNAWVDSDYDSDDYEEEWEDIQEEVIYPLYFTISEAFDELKPKDLPGSFIIADYWDGLINLAYEETEEQGLSKEEFSDRQKSRADQERSSQENRDRSSKGALQGWTPPPVEAMIDFLQGVYGIDELSSQIRRGKKKKLWKEGIDEGIATFLIESFGEDDGELEERLSDFFGVPLVYKRFLEAELLSPYWDYVLYPLIDALSDAWDIVKPKDLPGELGSGPGNTHDFDLYYEEED
jgi:hypothetical protein